MARPPSGIVVGSRVVITFVGHAAQAFSGISRLEYMAWRLEALAIADSVDRARSIVES